MRKRSYKGRIGLIALATSAVFAGSVPAVMADYFYPQAGPPEITVLSAPSSYTPDRAGSSLSNYTISLGLTSEAGANNISWVSVCLYDDDYESYYNGYTYYLDYSCGSDPRYSMQMYWNGSFGFEWASYYQMDSSKMPVRSVNGNSGTWDFTFNISEAMKQGSNWHFIVEACDVNDSCSTYSSKGAARSAASVSWFGWTYQPEFPINFGDVAKDGNSSFQVNTLGNSMSNGTAALSFETSNYLYNSGEASLPIDGGAVGAAPALGKVAVDCETEFFSNPTMRLKLTPQVMASGFFSSGASENGEYVGEYGCTLYYGGGAAVAGVPYYSNFYVGISQAP